MNEVMMKTKKYRSQFYRLFTKYELLSEFFKIKNSLEIKKLSPELFFKLFKEKEKRTSFM